jgi:cell division protein ZapA
MSGKPVPVTLRILDRDYVVACPENEKETLVASAKYLNQKVQEVREGGKVVGIERMVVVSALNIIHEYFQYKQQQEAQNQQVSQQVSGLHEKIELALNKFKS